MKFIAIFFILPILLRQKYNKSKISISYSAVKHKQMKLLKWIFNVNYLAKHQPQEY